MTIAAPPGGENAPGGSIAWVDRNIGKRRPDRVAWMHDLSLLDRRPAERRRPAHGTRGRRALPGPRRGRPVPGLPLVRPEPGGAGRARRRALASSGRRRRLAQLLARPRHENAPLASLIRAGPCVVI